MKRWSYAVVLLLTGTLLGTVITQSVLQGQPPAPANVPKGTVSYREVVKHVLPAVVSIEARTLPAARENGPRPRLDPRVPEEFRRFFEDFDVRPRQDFAPGMPRRLGFGSGFVVDPEGVILTCAHVVDGADQVVIELGDGRKFVSKEVRVDAKTDLATVRIDAGGELPFLKFGDSDKMEIGDQVLAVGAPFGLAGSVTHGIVSGKGRSLQMNMYEDFVQTDAAINPGNSGGPLVNLRGEVIAINSAIKTRSGAFHGVGLAISSNLARGVMQKLLEHGEVRRGYLGVQIKDLADRDLARRLGLREDQTGVLVTQTFEGAPAADGGVKEGDVITAVNDEAVRDGRDLQMAVARLPVGKAAKVTVLREGQPRTLTLTIAEQPEQFETLRVPVPQAPAREPESVKLDKLGVAVADLTPELAERLGFSEGSRGAIITRLDRDGAAALAGLSAGVLVKKVNRAEVSSAEEVRSALDKASLADGVLLQVETPQGGTNYVLLKSEGK